MSLSPWERVAEGRVRVSLVTQRQHPHPGPLPEGEGGGVAALRQPHALGGWSSSIVRM